MNFSIKINLFKPRKEKKTKIMSLLLLPNTNKLLVYK